MQHYDASFGLKKKRAKHGTKPSEHTSKHSEEENRPQQCKVKSDLFTTTGTKRSLSVSTLDVNGLIMKQNKTKHTRPCQRGIKSKPIYALGTI